MKIALLGATGFVGRAAAAALAAHPGVRRVLLVDYDVRAAKKFAKGLSPKCGWAMADVGRTPDLERILGDVDAVANAVGPCFQYETGILLCCAAKGKPCASIGDATLSGEDRRAVHDAFRRAGLAAVSGCGLSPGWTEIMAARLATGEPAPPGGPRTAPRRLFFWSPDRFGGYAFFRRMSRLRGPERPAPAGAPEGVCRETAGGDIAATPSGGTAVRRACRRLSGLGAVGMEFSAAVAFWMRGRIRGPVDTPAAAACLVRGGREEAQVVGRIDDPDGRLPGILLAEAAVRLAERRGNGKGLLPLPEIVGPKEAEEAARAAGARIVR